MNTTNALRRGASASPLVALVLLPGIVACSTPPPSMPHAGEQWSTKDESLARAKPDLPRLEVPEIPPRAKIELRRAAVDLLLQASNSTNPLLRAHAMESLHPMPRELPRVVTTALADENRGVRFAAAMTVGRKRMRSLVGDVEPLLDDTSDSVRAAAIYALSRCGRSVDLNPLGSMVMSDDPEVKGNAALVLGELGDASALPMLREAVRQESARVSVARTRIVDLQLAEAMVKLGMDSELQVIRAALFAPSDQAELTALSCQILGELKDAAYASSLHDMAVRAGRRQEPPEIRIAAAQALARIDASRAPVEVPMTYIGSERFEVRGQAAIALGWMKDDAVLPALSRMMSDTNALVQVAAAGAVLRVLEG